MAFIKNNYFLLLVMFPLFLVGIGYLLQVPYILNFWESSENRQLLSNIGVTYSFLATLLWCLLNRTYLFDKKLDIRTIITVLCTVAIIIWPYKYNWTINLFYTSLGLSLFEGIRKKQFQKPSWAMIFLFLYGLLQFVGMAWNKTMSFGEMYHTVQDQYFFVAIPIISCFYRFKKEEISKFVAIIFHFFILIVAFHLVAYLLLIIFHEMPIFTCFVFNKSYLGNISYYEVLIFTKITHPSFLAWVYMIIGGLGYTTWLINKKHIKLEEVILYTILVLSYTFIAQARVGQLGVFVLIIVFSTIEIYKRIPRKFFIAILSSIFIVSVGLITFLKHKSSFFKDQTRNELFNASIESIKQSPWIGSGTMSEYHILGTMNMPEDSFHHLHNDFIETLVRHGVIGLIIFLTLIVLFILRSFKNRDLRLFAFITTTIFIMITDSALYYAKIIIITALFIYTLYGDEKNSELNT